ncbi:hypothetical protein J4E93_002925 [Alternaria ventricosa]|uniref:uncharacterized protein n=1 Tax=Alternaria ventricosa TaxID=1187951 RepID=UPI0020C277B6|nr:uncharacterized protein J4E93_002925 [Alternaria ventricosa]KAI4650569.1 hypothetical protein J4E93_002925 [Alternaria ventricosa]
MSSQPNSYRDPSKKPLTTEEQDGSYHLRKGPKAYRPKAPSDDAEASYAKGAGGGESGQTAGSEAQSSLTFTAKPVKKDAGDGEDKPKMVKAILRPKVKGKDTKDEGESAQKK